MLTKTFTDTKLRHLRLEYHSLCDNVADNFKHNFRLLSINLKRQREAKLAKEISLVAGFYLILNFLVLLVTFYHQILGLNLETYNLYSWAETLVFLNSCSNPFICVWKNRQIRKSKNYFVQNIRDQERKLIFPTGLTVNAIYLC